MNQVNLIGNIGKSPEIKTFGTGTKVAKFSVAMNTYSKKKDQEPNTLWVDCEIWGNALDRFIKCQEKVDLGKRKIRVTGAIAVNAYTTSVGTEEKRISKFYVKVHDFELLDPLHSKHHSDNPPQNPEEPAETVTETIAEVTDAPGVSAVPQQLMLSTRRRTRRA
jgi:single-strand DNA-binding protein